MYPISVETLCDLTDGTIQGPVSTAVQIDGVVIDSRDARRGDAFFALQGHRQHGMQFATAALRDGAAVIVTDPSAFEGRQAGVTTPCVVVPDAEIALAQIAQHNRRSSDALVIAVTGSVGKTTTRKLITCVMETTHTGIQSPRNFNNHLGVPLSLLELQPGDEFAVIEIAASGPGEVAVLSAIAEPEMAVVTRVAPAHLAGFGTLQAVQQAKQELVKGLPQSGVAFLNADDPQVLKMAAATRARVVTFGESETADVRATDVVVTDSQLQFRVNGFGYDVPICGLHNLTNVLAAIAVGLEVGLDEQQIAAGLQRFEAAPGRCCVSAVGPWTVVDDTYNASPASVSAAIRFVDDYHNCHRRIVVLNDMLDLGDQSSDLHFGIGAALAASTVDHVAVLGEFSNDVIDGFLAAGGSINRISGFRDLHLMASMLDCLLSPGDLVLIKGSRATRMEQVAGLLANLAAAETSLRTAA
ncbi:MAG: UDP-N-acetylmuramoyl-tripeptide--D-alanyl-D-alanine ligase [Planctomycetaceae bacterium]